MQKYSFPHNDSSPTPAPSFNKMPKQASDPIVLYPGHALGGEAFIMYLNYSTRTHIFELEFCCVCFLTMKTN